MEKKIAAEVVKSILDCSAKLDKTIARVQLVAKEEEYSRYRRTIGQVMGIMLTDILNPIFEDYPDLKPKDLI
jgi:hypothetical protein